MYFFKICILLISMVTRQRPASKLSLSFLAQIFLKSGKAATCIHTINLSIVDKSGGGYCSVYLPLGYRLAQFGGGAI